jgi:hypothetical protein
LKAAYALKNGGIGDEGKTEGDSSKGPPVVAVVDAAGGVRQGLSELKQRIEHLAERCSARGYIIGVWMLESIQGKHPRRRACPHDEGAFA